MRTLLVLTCCLALTAVARAEDQDNQHKNKKEKHEQTNQPAVSNAGQGKKFQTLSNSSQIQGKQKLYTPNNFRATDGHVQSNTDLSVQHYKKEGKFKQGNELTGQNNLPAVQSNTHLQTNKAWKVQKFTLHANTGIQGVKFQGTTHIAGSQKWQGNNYAAFRLYTSQRHDRFWWNSHFNRIILIGGGYYYWDNGYWYPAWGYDPGFEFYAYDGPVYGYDGLPPDQVIANVQAALQAQGYYNGLVDGMLGPLTRAALAQYQADHGLYPTSAIDQPTLQTLGFA